MLGLPRIHEVLLIGRNRMPCREMGLKRLNWGRTHARTRFTVRVSSGGESHAERWDQGGRQVSG